MSKTTEQKQDSTFDTMRGGTKLKLVHPTSAVDQFNYMNATGAMQVTLAAFGRFQTGTSIQAPLFYPPTNLDGCDPSFMPEVPIICDKIEGEISIGEVSESGDSADTPKGMLDQDGTGEQPDEKLNCYPDPGVIPYLDMEWQGYVMVEAGGCTYETKARNIQNIGAQAAIIIEPYEDEDVRFTEDSLKDFYDGSGHSITIPTLIIEADDGEKLVDLI